MNKTSRHPFEQDVPTISRRDFINGSLVAASGLAIGNLVPSAASAKGYQHIGGAACGDEVGDDPRMARGGNRASTFDIAHWLRDRRLTFQRGSVVLSPGCDGNEGSFVIENEDRDYDVIIAGAGIAGLSSAFYLLRRRPELKILMLEANQFAGGNASCDDQAPLPVMAATCGAYGSVPESGYMRELFTETQIQPEKYIIRSPGGSYYFDENTPGVKPGYRGWKLDFLVRLARADLKYSDSDPYDENIMNDLKKCLKVMGALQGQEGAPDDPPELSSPKFDYLSRMTFAAYLTDVLHCDPRVVDFFSLFTVDCMGGTAHHVNAHTVFSFLDTTDESVGNKEKVGDGAGYDFAYPGGTARIAQQLVSWLTNPKSARRDFTIRLGAVALRVDADTLSSRGKASVTYFADGKFRSSTAKAVIVATHVQSAKNLIEHLADEERKAAWREFNSVPAIIANVAVRNMAPFVELGLGYANFSWGSRHWSNFIIADWTTENRHKPDRPSVLTFYGAITVPPEEFAAERVKLLTTPFEDYERSLKDDLSRVMRGTKFDFDKDVNAVFVYRWGHSMILPTSKSLFGNVVGRRGLLDRSKAPRRIACRPLGPISFAGQYTEGNPSTQCAMTSGFRATKEVLARL